MDQTQDSGYTSLHEFAQVYGDLFPSYVKEASREETLSPEGLSSLSYADMLHRQFPVHTKAACYLSSMFFMENRDRLKDRAGTIGRGLSKAAEAHGIQSDIVALLERNVELRKQAAVIPADDYMLPAERKYPMRTAAETTKAAEYLLEFDSWFTLSSRLDMAKRVLNKAAQYNVVLSEDQQVALQKRAGMGTFSPAEFGQQMHYRATTTKDTAVKAAIAQLASTVENNPELALDKKAIEEIACSIDALDRLVGVKYGNYIKAPVDFMFAGLFKLASSFVDNSAGTATGSIYTHDQLGSLSRSDVADMLGEKIASDTDIGMSVDVKKLASYVSSMPYMDALSFDWRMRELGFEPARKMPVALGISRDQREKLAMEYESTAR